jgi:hypothetical protein
MRDLDQMAKHIHDGDFEIGEAATGGIDARPHRHVENAQPALTDGRIGSIGEIAAIGDRSSSTESLNDGATMENYDDEWHVRRHRAPYLSQNP